MMVQVLNYSVAENGLDICSGYGILPDTDGVVSGIRSELINFSPRLTGGDGNPEDTKLA